MSSPHHIEAALGGTASAIGRHDQEESVPDPASALVELVRLLARQAARDHMRDACGCDPVTPTSPDQSQDPRP